MPPFCLIYFTVHVHSVIEFYLPYNFVNAVPDVTICTDRKSIKVLGMPRNFSVLLMGSCVIPFTEWHCKGTNNKY